MGYGMGIDWSGDPWGGAWGGTSYSGLRSYTGGWAYPSAQGMQLSVGGVLDDLGDWIKTTSGDILRVIVDEYGRRIVQKTGEVLSRTPLGPATAYAAVKDYTPYIIGAGVLLAALFLRR